MPRAPGLILQLCPQAKQCTAPPGSCSYRSPSRISGSMMPESGTSPAIGSRMRSDICPPPGVGVLNHGRWMVLAEGLAQNLANLTDGHTAFHACDQTWHDIAT